MAGVQQQRGGMKRAWAMIEVVGARLLKLMTEQYLLKIVAFKRTRF